MSRKKIFSKLKNFIRSVRRDLEQSNFEIVGDAVPKNSETTEKPDCTSDEFKSEMCQFEKDSKKEVEQVLDKFRQDKYLQNSLKLAVWTNDLNNAEFFLQNGAKINELIKKNKLLVGVIFSRKKIATRKQMLQLLIKYGLDTSYRNSRGLNLLNIFLHDYVRNDDHDAVEIVEILLDSRVPIDESTEKGWTPLNYSAFDGHMDMVKLLIKKGADVNKNCDGVFPLIQAAQCEVYDNEDLIDLLISNGADVNTADFSGHTALTAACLNNCGKVINLLIRKGADINVVTKYGTTAFSELRANYKNYDLSLTVMVKEFSKLAYLGLPVNSNDMDLIKRNPRAAKILENCTVELEKMNNTKVYWFYTYFSVLKMSKNNKKLVHLTRNSKFISQFEANLDEFPFYKDELGTILENAIQLRDKYDTLLSDLNSVFGDYLPDIVIRKMADHLNS